MLSASSGHFPRASPETENILDIVPHNPLGSRDLQVIGKHNCPCAVLIAGAE